MQIVSSISQDGKIIETTLRDQGSLIYKIAEKTTYSLSNIKIHLFFLNRAAKANFTRLMGVEPVNYGSVFIYKNGFRVYPYGEAGEDFFGIDKRKAQGFKRYLGTREILGRIEIIGPNESFKESTSRDGGFIKNEAYFELESFFTKTVRLLERYVVDTISWGDLSLFDDEWLEPKEALSRLEEVIRRMTNLREVLSIEYDSNLINKLKEKQKKSASAIIHEIKQIALKNENDTLLKNIEKVDKELRSAIETKSLAEQEAEESRELLRKTNAELKLKTEQNLFLKSVTSLDFDNILSLHHQIGIYGNDIDAQLLYWNRQLNKGYHLSIAELLTLLENRGCANKQILSIVKFATKANFKLTSEKIEADLILFIKQYIENIYIVYVDAPIKIN
ncbi:hypothetical protein [Paenibacillus barengoltzii]|uniref:hypothetical protein n=1 Tax=Paenibacillus barengoltzii TaxID=343517 RepID=UPI002FD8C242